MATVSHSKTEWTVALSLPSALFFFLLFLLFHSFVTVNTQDKKRAHWLFVNQCVPFNPFSVRQTESFMRFCLYSHISLNMYVLFCCDGQIPHKAASLLKSKAMTKLVMPLLPVNFSLALNLPHTLQ